MTLSNNDNIALGTAWCASAIIPDKETSPVRVTSGEESFESAARPFAAAFLFFELPFFGLGIAWSGAQELAVVTIHRMRMEVLCLYWR